MSANEAVLYRTQIVNPMIRREIDRLHEEAADCRHWTVGYLQDGAPTPEPAAKNHRMYRRDDLAALPYPNKIAAVDWLKPNGDNDLPVLAFIASSRATTFTGSSSTTFDIRAIGGRFSTSCGPPTPTSSARRCRTTARIRAGGGGGLS